MSMSDRQKEKIALSQILLNTANHHSAVRVSNLFSDHANRIGSLYSQGASEEIGTIIQFTCRC
jgi:hypothetical protein